MDAELEIGPEDTKIFVTYTFERSQPGSVFSPPEYAYVEIEKVEDEFGNDVTNEMLDEYFDVIENELYRIEEDKYR